MDKKKKKIKKVCNIILSLMLCLFSAFSFTGCIGGGIGGGGTGNVDNDNNDESQNPGGGSVEVPGQDEGWEFTDIFAGAIVGYNCDAEDDVFEDEYIGLTDFKTLVSRQCRVMSQFIAHSLFRAYGKYDDVVKNSLTAFTIGSGDDMFNRAFIIKYEDVYTDEFQHDMIMGVELENRGLLTYYGSIEGGYNLTAQQNNGNPYWAYDTSKYVDDMAWNYNYSLSALESEIYHDILYLYYWTNFENNDYVHQDINFDHVYDAGNYQCTDLVPRFKDWQTEKDNQANEKFLINAIATEKKLSSPSRYFLWHVAYYLAYGVIGEAAFEASLNAKNNVITGIDNIGDLPLTYDSTNKTFTYDDALRRNFQDYKGYDIVIANIVEQMSRIYLPSDKSNDLAQTIAIQFTDDVAAIPADQLIYVNLDCMRYEYIRDVTLIADAYNDVFVDLDPPDSLYENDDYDTQKLDPGTGGQLQKIILIPRLNKNKYKEDYYQITGALMGFRSDDAKSVEIWISGRKSDGKSIPKNPADACRVVEKYGFGNMDDVSFDGWTLKMETATTKSGMSIDNMLSKSFYTRKRTYKYNDPVKFEREFEYGVLKVHNNLFYQGELNLATNYICLDFEWYDDYVYYVDQQTGNSWYSTAGNRIMSPEVNLMFFMVY